MSFFSNLFKPTRAQWNTSDFSAISFSSRKGSVSLCPSTNCRLKLTGRILLKNPWELSKTLGILLTGMGRDGVSGLGAIKSKGGKTIAESEETSILYGMPKIAAEEGVAKLIVPNYKITEEMIKFVS